MIMAGIIRIQKKHDYTTIQLPYLEPVYLKYHGYIEVNLTFP